MGAKGKLSLMGTINVQPDAYVLVSEQKKEAARGIDRPKMMHDLVFKKVPLLGMERGMMWNHDRFLLPEEYSNWISGVEFSNMCLKAETDSKILVMKQEMFNYIADREKQFGVFLRECASMQNNWI